MPVSTVHRTRARRHLAAGVMTAIAVLLSACDSSDAPPGPTAPVIVIQPENLVLAEGASSNLSVTATSDAGPIAYQWFNVTTGSNVPGGLGSDLDIGPVSYRSNGTQFNVGLTNTVGTTTSATGTLTVTERSWSAAAEALAGNVRQSATVVDSNGHTHLVAVTGNNLAAGIEARIQLRSLDSTQANAFVAPSQAQLQASTTLSVNSTSVKLAANNNGFAMAVWHLNGAVWAALFQPPTTQQPQGHWHFPVRVSLNTANSALDPAVVAVGEDFEVVWRQRDGTTGPHAIMATHYDRPNNNWSPAVAIQSRLGETEAPQIAADGNGNVLAAWRHVGEGVWSNRHAAGALWSGTTTQLDSSDTFLEALCLNAAGRGVVVTSNRAGAGLATRLDLALPGLIVSGGGRLINAYGSSPAVAIDGSGRIQVLGVSVNSGNGDSRLFRWFYDPNFASWGGPEAVSDNVAAGFITTGNGVRDPRVSGSDTEGNFIVSWLERVADGDAPLSHVRARRFHAGLDAWRPIASVGDGNSLPAGVTMGSRGNATMVFGATSGPALQAASFR